MSSDKTLRKWLAVRRYRWALFRHELRDNTLVKIATNPTFSRSIGRTREERNANLRLMSDRWWARGPKPEDYGLRPEDVT